jgi:hypothetical protein
MLPIIALVSVALVDPRLVGEPNPGSADFSHLVMELVYPETVNGEGCVL